MRSELAPARDLRNGTNYATYLIGATGPVYRRDDTAGTVSWYLFDGLGSVLAEVNPSGTVTASRKYDVYGSVRSGSSGTSAHKFVGQLCHPSDDNTGLIYMQARYMDPVCGRFMSEDPGRHDANWFSYCRNRPTGGVDPDGKNWLFDVVIAGFLILLAIALGVEGIAIGAAICAVLALIAVAWAIFEGIRDGNEAKSKLDNLIKKQNKFGRDDEANAEAMIIDLKQQGGFSMAVAGWYAELVFGILEIDDV